MMSREIYLAGISCILSSLGSNFYLVISIVSSILFPVIQLDENRFFRLLLNVERKSLRACKNRREREREWWAKNECLERGAEGQIRGGVEEEARA